MAGVVYEPGLHPVPDTVTCMLATLLPMVTCVVLATKFATIVFALVIATDNGLVEPLASPDQFANL
jgi:hypothetical protein